MIDKHPDHLVSSIRGCGRRAVVRGALVGLGSAVASSLVPDLTSTLYPPTAIASDQYRRPSRNLPVGKKLLFYHRPLNSSYITLVPIQDHMTKVGFLSKGAWKLPKDSTGTGYYDHSPSGIKAYADQIWKFFMMAGGHDAQCNIAWWDWEESVRSTHYAINVPTSVNYERSTDSWHASLYDMTVPIGRHFPVTAAHADELRQEAVRYNSEVARALTMKARSSGWTAFEQYSYLHPDHPSGAIGSSARLDLSSYNDQARYLKATMIQPYMLGGGPSAYFSGDITILKDKPSNFWIDDMASTTAKLKQAFGDDIKIIRTIWCQWDSIGGNHSIYPNDDPCIPAGYIKKAMNAMLDAGADGFTVFQSSLINNSTDALQQRFAERHSEIAEVVKAHGNFVGIRY